MGRLFDNPPYYISAYSLAVKRGFTGTLDQWLASLKGAPAELRFEGDKIQWRFNPEVDTTDTGWHDLMSVDELRGQVVAAVLEQARAYAQTAQNASGEAQGAAAAADQMKDLAVGAANAAQNASGTARGYAEAAAQTLASAVKKVGTQVPDEDGVVVVYAGETVYTLQDISYQGSVAGFLDLLFRNGRLHFCDYPVPETDGETATALDEAVYPAPVYTGDYVIGSNGYIAKVSLAIPDANYNLLGTGLHLNLTSFEGANFSGDVSIKGDGNVFSVRDDADTLCFGMLGPNELQLGKEKLNKHGNRVADWLIKLAAEKSDGQTRLSAKDLNDELVNITVPEIPSKPTDAVSKKYADSLIGEDLTEDFIEAQLETPELTETAFLLQLTPATGHFRKYFIYDDDQEKLWTMEVVKVNEDLYQTETIFVGGSKTVTEYVNGEEQ